MDLLETTIPFWVLALTGVFLFACILSIGLSRFLKKLANHSRIRSTVWNHALLVGFRKPAFFLVWFACAGWTIKIAMSILEAPVLDELLDFNRVVLIILLCWALVRTIRQVESNFLDPTKTSIKEADPTSVTAIGRLFRVTTFIITALIIMQVLGFSISGLLAFGGAGGLVIGYGAKDMLANLFGGLFIYMDKPFGVGDWVRSPDKNIEGTVEYIGWRQTRIRTFDKRPLYVPNATFTNISVENPSRMQNRRIKETVGLRYSDSTCIDAILAETRIYLQQHEAIDQDKIVMVNLNRFGPSSLDFFIYCFTKTTDWATFHTIKERVLLDVLAIIHRHGADVAFPTQTLDLPKEALITTRKN